MVGGGGRGEPFEGTGRMVQEETVPERAVVTNLSRQSSKREGTCG